MGGELHSVCVTCQRCCAFFGEIDPVLKYAIGQGNLRPTFRRLRHSHVIFSVLKVCLSARAERSTDDDIMWDI